MLDSLQHIDQEIFLFFNGIASPFWDEFMWLFSDKLVWIPLYAALLYVIWKNFNTGAFILSVISIALVIVFTDQICGSLIRPEIQRMRPSNPNNPISQYVHIVNEKRGGRYGFPSCHAANTFGLAFISMFLLKRALINAFLFPWAIITSYSRVYLGVHYPGDLLAGLIVGLCGACIIYMIYKGIIHWKKSGKILKITTWDKEIVNNQVKIRYSGYLVFTGLLTISLFVIYSLFEISL